MGSIATSREELAWLWSFGEEALAARVVGENDVPREQLLRIFNAAWKYASEDRYVLPSGNSMMIGKALAYGAVEVLEGEERELAQQRRGPGARLADPYA